jgi:hypothetical protein
MRILQRKRSGEHDEESGEEEKKEIAVWLPSTNSDKDWLFLKV